MSKKMPSVIPEEVLRKSQTISLGTPRMGTGKKQPLRESLTYKERVLRENLPELGIHNLQAVVKRMQEDPAYAADIAWQLRQPRNVSKTRAAVAALRTQKEPMLNADPQSITNALAYSEPNHKDRVVKGSLYDRMVVKPTTSRAAKQEYSSAFWGERLWNVYTLKYTKGFVVVTDKGSESKVFPTYGELKAAAVKSGWEIVR